MSCLLSSCGGGDGHRSAADAAPDTGGDGEEDAGEVELAFAGIETAAWDGADGLIATWGAAESDLAIGYVLFVESLAEGTVIEEETTDLEAHVVGLEDGEYRLRVEARVEGRAEDGDRSLVQLVGQNRIVFRSEVSLPGAASVWGEGELVVLAAGSGGRSFLVVDTTDVENPEIIADVDDAGFVTEVKLGDGMLFTNGQAPPGWGASWDGIGVRIFDFSDPTDPELLGVVGAPHTGVHNLTYADDVLVVADTATYTMGIYDVSDPTLPELARTWVPPGGSYVHDMALVDGLLYVAFITGFAVLDLTDLANPEEVVFHEYGPGPYAVCHNAWPTADGSTVLTTDETAGGHVRFWDVRDPEDVQEVGSWAVENPLHTVHNVHVRDEYAFVAYYLDGVIVLDVSDVTAPELVGSYDSLDEKALGLGPTAWAGAWGVWPFGPHVAVSDEQRGLLLFDHFPEVIR